MTETKCLTRRGLLKGSFIFFGGALISKYSKYLPPISSSASTTTKRIYIAPDDHTDYFWSADEETYRQAFLEMIDYYLDLADSTQSNPPEYQSRWNCDGSFWMWTYQKNKTASQFQRLIDRIKSGHISVPLNALCICPGGAPAEAVLRGMYYPGQIERQHNTRFRLAYLIENQTLPYGVVSLFAGAGAQYSWKGICGCDSQVGDAGDREHDIYWWTGPDGNRLLMKWNSMLVGNQSMGGYAEARNPAGEVEYVDTDPDFIASYPYQVIGAFGKGWDDLKTMTDEFVTVAQNKSNAARQVIVSNEEDFFVDFEAEYGGSLPSVAASFGNEWDLYCAAMAEVSARIKRSVEKLRAAEAMATLVSLQAPTFMNGYQDDREQAWMDLGLFWEHNWGMAGFNEWDLLVQQRMNWQKRLAGEIESYVNNIHEDAISALGGLIQRSDTNPRFFVFNPLSWTRSDYVDYLHNGIDPVHVIDLLTQEEVPSQIVNMEGKQYLRILASDVPAVGYKVFEIRSGAGQVFSDAAAIDGNILENQNYRITLADRGAIISLIDKTRGDWEIVDEALNDLGPSSGSLQVENAGPVTVTLKVTASQPLSHTTRITMIRGVNRIEIRNDINQNFDAVYTWGYDFNLDKPDIWHEEVGAVIRARLTTQGGHYSPRNARYDWLTLNHFADISNTSIGVTLSNADCYFMKTGNSTVDALDTTAAYIKVLVGGRVANGNNGLPDQGGDTHFLQRFALRSHDAYNPIDAMRFALEHQNPLVAGEVTGGSVYPEKTYSLLTIDNSNVLLWALKPHEDGINQGIITRLWNLSASQQSVKLTMTPGPILTAKRTTHIETVIANAQVSSGNLVASFKPQQMQTFAMHLSELPDDQSHRQNLPFLSNQHKNMSIIQKCRKKSGLIKE